MRLRAMLLQLRVCMNMGKTVFVPSSATRLLFTRAFHAPIAGNAARALAPGGVTVQMLGGEGIKLSSDAQQLKEWVEKGAGAGMASKESGVSSHLLRVPCTHTHVTECGAGFMHACCAS
jgi:hypothetical protein